MSGTLKDKINDQFYIMFQNTLARKRVATPPIAVLIPIFILLSLTYLGLLSKLYPEPRQLFSGAHLICSFPTYLGLLLSLIGIVCTVFKVRNLSREARLLQNTLLAYRLTGDFPPQTPWHLIGYGLEKKTEEGSPDP